MSNQASTRFSLLFTSSEIVPRMLSTLSCVIVGMTGPRDRRRRPLLTYLPPTDIIAHPGLRLVLVRGVPSPWSQAAKAILEIKGLPYVAAPLEVAGANAEI